VSAGDIHLYDVRPRKDRRGVDLISDAVPFGRLCSSQALRHSSRFFRNQFPC